MLLIQCRSIISQPIRYGFIGLVTALQIFSQPVGAANREIDLLYKVSWGAFHLADARSQWHLQDRKAVILGSVKSDGIAQILSGFQSASNAELDLIGDKWQPTFLTLSRVTKSKQISSSVHWSSAGEILSDFQDPPLDFEEVFPIPMKMKRQVIDPYSAVLHQLDYITKANECSGSYEVYDGLRRFEISFDTRGEASIVEDRPYSFGGVALHCTLVVTPKGGHRIKSDWHKKPIEDRQANIYFGQFLDGFVLPVRVEINARFGTGVARLDLTKSTIEGVLLQP